MGGGDGVGQRPLVPARQAPPSTARARLHESMRAPRAGARWTLIPGRWHKVCAAYAAATSIQTVSSAPSIAPRRRYAADVRHCVRGTSCRGTQNPVLSCGYAQAGRPPWRSPGLAGRRRPTISGRHRRQAGHRATDHASMDATGIPGVRGRVRTFRHSASRTSH